MIKVAATIVVGVALLAVTLPELKALRKAAPPAERLGYLPSAESIYIGSLEYKLLVSQLLFNDTIFYYGSVSDTPKAVPDYKRLYLYLDSSTKLNPYNIDSYYFAQAVLTWDAGMVRETNVLLERGARRRTWDFYLPFFLGFNHFYFLNEFSEAGTWFTQAAKINPSAEFLTTLAARLYYQANKTDLAIRYLEQQLRETPNESLKKRISIRLTALKSIQELERGVQAFRERRGTLPSTLEDVYKAGLIAVVPPDPYGGKFYLDQRDGRVKTTSKLAPAGVENGRH